MQAVSTDEILIEPGLTEFNYFWDLWRFRELFFFLAWRDLKVRYKQTIIGVSWALIRPFLTMVIFTIVFGKLAGLSAAGIPYPLLVFAALLPWQFFSNALSGTSESMVGNAHIITKIYFPRLIIPASSILVGLVDASISFGILILLYLYYGYLPPLSVLSLPFFVCLAFISSFGAGLWLAALNVRYRDFRIIVPFILQFGLYISPVGFQSSIVPENWRIIYSLNPMVGVIDGFRWALIPDFPLFWPSIVASLIIGTVLFVSGLLFFRKSERLFADVI
ncbi:MAG: ABC transporter permease [Candidatus Riflebacteria bacterium]|nr:ABC transporter permease [Candidatus Riflebacteria bacterium]